MTSMSPTESIETSNPPTPELSIVVPALNEADNVAPLAEQVRHAVIEAGVSAELIVVDDGSTDSTPRKLRDLASQYPWLRPLRREQPRGQSAAMLAGITAARGRLIATLDADLQNDPADLPRMMKVLAEQKADLVQGDRSHDRQDHLIRRVSSWVGRVTRRIVLGDTVRDTGCSARVMTAAVARQLPLQFRGMHRFIPAYARIIGAKIVEVPVTHRPRTAGKTKYGLGVFSRGFAGLADCFAVRWMIRRHRESHVEPIQKAKPPEQPPAPPTEPPTEPPTDPTRGDL